MEPTSSVPMTGRSWQGTNKTSQCHPPLNLPNCSVVRFAGVTLAEAHVKHPEKPDDSNLEAQSNLPRLSKFIIPIFWNKHPESCARVEGSFSK